MEKENAKIDPARRATLVVLMTVTARTVWARSLQGPQASTCGSCVPSGTTQTFGTDGRPPAGKQPSSLY
jgi:hypothetical protein